MLCSLCRGDNGDFLPAAQWMDSTRGHFAQPLLAGKYLSTVRLFQGDQEIPGKVDDSQLLPLFPLGWHSGTYRLKVEDTWPDNPELGWPNGAVHRLTPRTTTVATFNSTPPASNLPPGYSCLDGGNRCAFQPVIQLDYQLGLDLLNQAPAGRTHTFEVTAGHHEAADSAGTIIEFRLWYSTNDGTSWNPATIVELARRPAQAQTCSPERLEVFAGTGAPRRDAVWNDSTQATASGGVDRNGDDLNTGTRQDHCHSDHTSPVLSSW
jgi:hypothetical protein